MLHATHRCHALIHAWPARVMRSRIEMEGDTMRGSTLHRRNANARARGVTLVWAAIVMFVLVGFVALAVDWGYSYYTTQKLQNAADSAALAGAQRVWFSHGEARERAKDFSSANEAGGDPVLLDETDS